MNFSEFKKINKDARLTDEQLQSIAGGDNGLMASVAASFGSNLANVSAYTQQTTTNPLGAAAMTCGSEVFFSTSNSIPMDLGHESGHVVNGMPSRP